MKISNFRDYSRDGAGQEFATVDVTERFLFLTYTRPRRVAKRWGKWQWVDTLKGCPGYLVKDAQRVATLTSARRWPLAHTLPVNNRKRAERAKAMLEAYIVDERDDRVTDVLTDLRHYCHAHDLVWEAQLELVEMHFNAELADES